MLLLEVLSELEPLRLDGVVYDSAPSAEGTIRPIAGPVIAYLSGGTLRERLAAVWSTLWPALLAFPVRKRLIYPILMACMTLLSIFPGASCSAYSDGDRLVWRSHVEQFVARRRDQGSIVETRNFRKEYTSATSARNRIPSRPAPGGWRRRCSCRVTVNNTSTIPHARHPPSARPPSRRRGTAPAAPPCPA